MATTSSTSSAALPAVSSLGSGSNLPLQDILDKLQANEEVALTNIQTQQSEIQSKITAYGTIQSAISTLQTAAKALTSADTYNAAKAVVTGDGFTATAQSSAITGTYSIQVDALATAETLKTGAFSSRTDANGTGGSLTVTLADGTTASVDLSSDTSLNGVASAINGNSKLGIKASIINDGSGNSYLMITSSATGTKAAVTGLNVTGNATLATALNYGSGVTSSNVSRVGDPATDAQITINGSIVVTSASNTVDSAIDGITLTLNEVTDTAGSLRITTDTTAQATAIQSFVTAYNTVASLISTATAYDTTSESGSVLTGDSTVRTIQQSLAAALRVTNSGGDIASLADLGITTDADAKNGTLKLDVNVMTEALVNHPDDVKTLLFGTSGLGATFTTSTTSILQTGGLIDNRTDGLQSTYDSLQDTYDSRKDRIDADIATMRAQFVALDAFVAQMNSTSSYLTQQFEALTKSTS
ncbi:MULTISPECIES: flagellar filament capping protein FliD [unclassified Achromobacter]|uniref:flagellar filament capping protein FliD n=1 Tax=unclassified Achromobacter TaxID=2626865 RepID=UPI000B519A37|nr:MULTISPECIES: flagellar filament capping protein FliD [unclassified Achromobacter]OWT79987.1 flagellar hook protein FliD [Achromobacter sp. HZ34]OWT81871.1 flagellar hook protein FliD [Achromobacter sp. HZ28]